ncbi:hypothetical protein LY76DRAFT_339999 [Colletotrichum caudatum]|nr:hypothetical protein LY76DRAFT_339999 [Colletotrichum caudatum]
MPSLIDTGLPPQVASGFSKVDSQPSVLSHGVRRANHAQSQRGGLGEAKKKKKAYLGCLQFEVTRASANLKCSSRTIVRLLVPFVPSTTRDFSVAITAVFLAISDISIRKPAFGPLTVARR